jgi:hypothetical protein
MEIGRSASESRRSAVCWTFQVTDAPLDGKPKSETPKGTW